MAEVRFLPPAAKFIKKRKDRHYEHDIYTSIVIRNSIPSIPDKRYTLIMYDVKEGYGFSLTNDETDWIFGLIFVIL